MASGARAVLVKGGHLSGAPATDVLVTKAGVKHYTGAWIETRNTHGTGCTYSAAVATWLARGLALEEAVGVSKRFVTAAIRAGLAVGRGVGPTNPFFFLDGGDWRLGEPAAGEFLAGLRPSPPRNPISGRLMVVTDETLQTRYGHAELARLAALGGADWVQFREKRPRTTRELGDIARAMAAELGGRSRLVVDDRVDVAAASGVRAVHLGRNDLAVETARRILGPDAIVGGTANSFEEALRVAAGPVDYLGVGPVFATGSKANPAPVIGLEGLGAIVGAVDLPVFAIGGITPERVADVLATGAFGIAVLSAVIAHEDPCAATAAFRRRIDGSSGADAPGGRRGGD
jgi:thiamine-phosphate diphosphorylase